MNMKNNKTTAGTLRRMFRFIFKNHKKGFLVVVVGILLSVAGGLLANSFVQLLIDDYILKMIKTGEDLYGGMALMICLMAAMFVVSILGTFIYSRGMAIIA